MKKIFAALLLTGILFTAKNTIALTSGDPTDKLATPETKALYNQLKAASGQQIMFGQYYLAKISTWEDPYGTNSQCYKITGKVPLILHVDYKSDQWRTISKWTDQLKAHYSKGGVIMVSWHMQNWVTDGDMRDLTGNPIVNILPGGSARTKYLAALDGFANYFLNLKDANGKLIPVIFRPYHENDGGWFWWGNTSGANVSTTSVTSTTSNTSGGKISYFSNDASLTRVRVHYTVDWGKIGSKVKIGGTWNYNGTYDVSNLTPTTFDIAHGWQLGEWNNTKKYWTSSWTSPAGTLSSNTAYVALWKDLVTYLRDKKGVHNLLYCYSPEIIIGFAYDGPLYPGDTYVDILGLDNYAKTITSSAFKATPLSRLQTLRDLSVAKNKPFGLCEGLRNEYPNKVVSDPNSDGIYPKYWTEQLINPILADSKAKYASFVMVWHSNPGSTNKGWGPVKGYADEQSFRNISNNPKVKFLQY